MHVINFKEHLFTVLLIIATYVGHVGCSPAGGLTTAADSLYNVHINGPSYDFKRPTEKYFLPYILEEISGLSYYEDNILACIQDEDGKLFFYNLVGKNIVHTILFEYDGDYEGVEVVGNDAYIIKSNGDIFRLTIDFNRDKYQADKIDTPLKSKNDIEGLGYDKSIDRLLIVTKAEAGINEKKDKDSRGIYSFKLEAKEFDDEPRFIITERERRDFYKQHRPNQSYDDKRLLFKPSGIAVHPITGNYYLIASIGKVMLVVSPDGTILESYAIPPSILTQPEGICFDQDGTMYISSEGEGDRGYILKYAYLK